MANGPGKSHRKEISLELAEMFPTEDELSGAAG